MKRCAGQFTLSIAARMRAYVLVALSGPAVFVPAALLAETQSAPDDLAALLAEADTPGMRARLRRVQASELEGEALPAWYRPNVSVEAGYGGAANPTDDQSGPTARIVGEWTLWDGGRTEAERRQWSARARLDQLRARLEMVSLQQKLAEAYWRASRLRSLGALAEEERSDSLLLRRRLGPRLRLGSVGRSDAEAAAMQADRLQQESRLLQRAHQQSEERLAVLAGLSTNRFSVPALEETVSLARENSAGSEETAPGTSLLVRIAEARADVLAAEAEALEGELYWPALLLDVYGGYGPRMDALDPAKPEVGAALRFRVPLMERRNRSNRTEAADARAEAARWEAQQALREARVQWLELRQNIAADREALVSGEQWIRRARQNLERGYAEFSRGIKSPTDMLAAIETLYDLRRERMERLFRLRLNETRLTLLAKAAREAPQASVEDAEIEEN